MRITALALIALTLSAGTAAARQKETETVDRTIAFSRGRHAQTEELLRRRARHRHVRQRRRHPRGPDRATRDRLDNIKLDIQVNGSTIEIEANRKVAGWDEKDNNVVETRFEIQVPSATNLDLHGLLGRPDRARHDRRHRGAHLQRQHRSRRVGGASAAPDLKAETFSGDIKARVPQGSNGQVAFNTFSGDLRSDLPLMLHGKSQPQHRRRPRQRRRLEARVQDLQRRCEAGQVSGRCITLARCASARASSFFIVLLPARRGCTRSAGLFSEQNARAHVAMLAGTIGSRPIGTEANARARAYLIDQLKLYGYDVRVQETDARRAELGRTARVSNIIAVLPGAQAGSDRASLALRFVAGVAWRGRRWARRGGVARSGARAGRATRTGSGRIFVLLTDGEESGLMGAAGAGDRSRGDVPAPGVHQHRGGRIRRDRDAVRDGTGQWLARSVRGRAARRIRAAARSHRDLPPAAERHRLHRSSRARTFPD